MDNFQIQTAPGAGNAVAVLMITATLYLALGVLGLSFAVAPGYASPIFPAAGFAVASMLYSNGRSWPGVWAGSLALNLVVAWWHNDLDWHSSLIAAGIAVGTTLQVLVARRLVVHSVKNGWQTLQNDRDIILSLALAGPVACMVSATVGVSVIYASQSVSTLEYLHAWWNWWIGDTLGVLVILPLSLTLRYWRQPPWRGRLTILMPPMLVTLTLVGAAFVAVAQWETSQRKHAIRDHGEALAKVLEQRFSAHQEALAALRRLLEVSPDMTYGQFEYFTHITLKDNPDIFALSINPYVLQPEREAFERRLAVRTGTPGFEINEMNGGQRTRAAERAEYVPIGFIAPLEGNRSAIGYDIESEPARRDAIQRARQSRAPAITAPLRLVQEEKQRVGVLIMLPAYSKQDADSSSPNDGSGLIGFAVGVIKVDEMVEIATRSMSIPGLVFTLSDEQAGAGSTLIHHSNPSAIPQEDFPAWHKPLTMGGRTWTLQVFPAAEFMNQKPHWAALAVAASGLVLATLLQILLLGTTGRSAVIERKVQEQTAELQAQRDALEDRNAQLLDSEQRFRMLFVHLPVAYQALDSEGRWLDANQKMADLLGFAAPEQMRGLNFVDYCSDDGRSQFNESFERFKRTLSAEEQRTLRRRDGQAVTVLIVGRIQLDTKGNFMRAHCILADISERQAMERVLSNMTEATLRHLGQELHDDLGQILSGSAMLADTLAPRVRIVVVPIGSDNPGGQT